MARSAALVETIKRTLKSRGMSYRQLADELGLSESAIKQMFSSGNMTLKRLDALGEVLGLDISDLIALTEAGEKRIEQLSVTEERALVDDLVLLVVAYCAVNHWSFEDIVERYDITETECVKRLAQLDRMKIIELQPGNRIKLLISTNFDWQPNGPIENFFRKQVQSQFFSSRFSEDGELRLVKNGDISIRSQHMLAERLRGVGEIFDSTVFEERKLPNDERRGTTMVVAIRHWQFTAFAKLERGEKN